MFEDIIGEEELKLFEKSKRDVERLLEKYQKLGTPEEIEEAMDVATRIIRKYQEDKPSC